ncbi:MAG: AAA family ATPase, partial [Planctomycetia bacterium]|nr:AAA family ATPase [Planctomycetia bacterium]
VERAVGLAWSVTGHLRRVIQTSSFGVKVPLEDHIRMDNVIIFMPPSNGSQNTRSAVGAKFKSLLSIEETFAEAADAQVSPPVNPHLCAPQVCVALGNILLDIFTKSAGSMGNAGTIEADDGGTLDASQSAHEHENHSTQPPGKRQAKSTAPGGSSSAATSEKAAENLLMLGMPLSICRLVGDLLDAEVKEPAQAFSALSLEDALGADGTRPKKCAIRSIHEALQDLEQMRTFPEKFLFDRACPQDAMDDTCLFTASTDVQLIGRERESLVLMTSMNKISAHVRDAEQSSNNSVSSQDEKFLCEALFLCGYAGSGKSSLLYSLLHTCTKDQWFVLSCKFSQQSSPHTILAEAFNSFFGKWGAAKDDPNSDLPPAMVESFDNICENICNAMDGEGLRRLCEFVPNFSRVYPSIVSRSLSPQSDNGVSSMDKVGSGSKRMRNLFHVLLKSICSMGHPGQLFVNTLSLFFLISDVYLNVDAVAALFINLGPVLFTLDDLQWSESRIIDDLSDFVLNYIHDTKEFLDACQRGLMIAGTFRNNQVERSNELINKISLMDETGKANVNFITTGDFSKEEVVNLVARELCLPRRYVSDLANLAHRKTRGNRESAYDRMSHSKYFMTLMSAIFPSKFLPAFFVLQFLRSIIKNKMLTYSIRHRQWIWDYDVVDMQMISDDVAQLLTTTFDQLPSSLLEVLKVISCLGFQVDEATVEALDSGNDILPISMRGALPLAVEEGMLEKAGPIFQFTHDIIHQTVYALIP